MANDRNTGHLVKLVTLTAERRRMLPYKKRYLVVSVLAAVMLCAVWVFAASPSLAAMAKKKAAPKVEVVEVQHSRRLGPQVQTIDVSGLFDTKKSKPKIRRARPRLADTVKDNGVKDNAVDSAQDFDDSPSIERLFEYINRARLALAVYNQAYAVQHINHASYQCELLEESAPQPMITHIKIGNFLYNHGKHLAYYYYFPLGSELQEWQTPDTAPFWAQNGGVGVRDVQLAHVIVTMNAGDVRQTLEKAKQAITDNKLDQAQDILTRLNNKIATMEKTEELPLTKARDNIMLANYFLIANNYDAARNALRHARDGLSDARKKEHDQANRENLDELNQEIMKTERQIQAKNPSLLGDASAQLEDWWGRLSQWSGAED